MEESPQYDFGKIKGKVKHWSKPAWLVSPLFTEETEDNELVNMH